ncbi:tripartite tricarboxylate transporter TctB family protein [Rhodoferax sp.]|uniref:tripartite tricarboxylate transporter TctB family protein n=1 Tax=Rhodoferax sp. TaxID=50421 RepID=UPI0025D5EEAB|nr:tripartite tricarboxylate transporter TctB family protein [Rhodoferax sp.]MCM2342003.1 tripartite tricarboxylate transporter TctB family protein [Rhodoferax sp.]
MKSDRIFAAIVLAASLGMMWATTQIEESFIQDPLGPKSFPMLIAALMAVSAVVMFLKPDADPHWPGVYKLLELLATTGVLIAYAQLLPIAGFVLATTCASAFLTWRLGGTARQSAIGGVSTAVGIFLLFQYALGVNMAKGPWGF